VKERNDARLSGFCVSARVFAQALPSAITLQTWRTPHENTHPCPANSSFLSSAPRHAPPTIPLVGKWKLNPEKSQFSGLTYKIDDLGGDKYRFAFGERFGNNPARRERSSDEIWQYLGDYEDGREYPGNPSRSAMAKSRLRTRGASPMVADLRDHDRAKTAGRIDLS